MNKTLKKTLSIILTILMIATTIPFAFAADETPPTREIDGKTYYELDSADDLYWFAEQVNGGDVEINAILTDDIVVNENLLTEKLILTEKVERKNMGHTVEVVKVCVAEVKTGEYVREWIPMGTDLWVNMYSGHFNGNGKTISGLYVNEMYDNAGLVGNAYGCTIENLTLEDSYFNCEYNFAGAFVAFAVAPNGEPVYLKNLVNKSVVCGRNAGGILGCAQGTTHISGCINFGTIYPFAESYSYYNEYCGGGIAGTMLNTFSATDCVNLGNAEYTFVSDKDSFTNCYYLDTASKGVSFDTDNVTAVTAEEVASGFVCEKIGGHKTEIITVEPTCTEIGFEKIECLICEYSVMQKEFPALDHDIVIDEAVAPTCTETGLAEGSHCSRCDDMTVAQEIIPALDHDIVIDEAVAPTCTETGLAEGSHCSRCDDMTVAQEVVPDLGGHINEDGDTLCDRCGEIILCKDCDRPVHEGFIQNVICWFLMLINLIKSMFA